MIDRATPFSDYIVYVDESGDHNLVKTDPHYPVFVLAFCIIKKSDYYTTVSPAIQRLKFEFFGHDMVVLHEHEIRKSKKPFDFLMNQSKRRAFMGRLSDLITQAPFHVIASAIDKTELNRQFEDPENPYKVAMAFCLEQTFEFLKSVGQADRLTHIVVESRGKKEDKDLELEFRRICQGLNRHGEGYPFDIVLTEKRVNSGGLQLADLFARPIGLQVIRPDQPNRAYEMIAPKFWNQASQEQDKSGLHIYPINIP